MAEDGKQKQRQRGFALLLVLWVLTILIVIVLSFSMMTRTESQAALSHREGLERKYLAEAALQRGIVELLYRAANKSPGTILEGREVFRVDGTSYQGQVGDGAYELRIASEAGKINVNALTDASAVLLRNLLVNAGVREEEADTIVDSVLDWKDADDLHRLHGAESDYYAALPQPYKARNADFETLEEMLLVRGMTAEILFGSGEKRGIAPFLTLYSKGEKIDLSTAPKEVLMAIPDVTADTARRIIEYRQSAEFRGMEDLQSLGGESLAQLMQYAGMEEGTVFTIDAAGYKEDRKKGFTIRATLVLEGPASYRYLYYKIPAGL